MIYYTKINGKFFQKIYLICFSYRAMSALSEDRQNAIGQFASFVSLPLERHCPSGNFCADLTLSTAIENQV